MKICAFGDSFVYGSDLNDCTDSSYSEKTYPALIAQSLDLEYNCFAKPGCGNRFILNTILDSISYDNFFIISWSWIDRFDYLNIQSNTWNTVRPSLDNKIIDSFYYRNLHSELLDKQTTLGYIFQAINVLQQEKIPFFMTCIDNLVFCTNWHCTPGIELLQQKTKQHISLIDGMSFIDWATKHDYEISNKMHPLEQAHKGAASYWMPTVKNLLDI